MIYLLFLNDGAIAWSQNRTVLERVCNKLKALVKFSREGGLGLYYHIVEVPTRLDTDATMGMALGFVENEARHRIFRGVHRLPLGAMDILNGPWENE